MKKILGIIVAGLLVAGFVSQASAAFTDDQELIRVVYNTSYNGSSGQPTPGSGTYDVITDLGNLSTLIGQVNSSGSTTVGGGVNAFTAASFTVNSSTVNTGFASNLSGLQVAYFAIDNTNDIAWTSGSQTAKLQSTGFFDSFSDVNNPLSLATTKQVYATGTNTAVFAQSNVNSFTGTVEKAPEGPGSYVGFLTTRNAFDTEGNVAALVAAGANGFQYLYSFGLSPASIADGNGAYDAQPGMLVTAADGQALEIFTNANGSTTLEAAPVPVPPSLLLLVPGLLGLIGIRRRLS